MKKKKPVDIRNKNLIIESVTKKDKKLSRLTVQDLPYMHYLPQSPTYQDIPSRIIDSSIDLSKTIYRISNKIIYDVLVLK